MVQVSLHCSCVIWISNILVFKPNTLVEVQRVLLQGKTLGFSLGGAEKNSGLFVQGNFQDSKHKI